MQGPIYESTECRHHRIARSVPDRRKQRRQATGEDDAMQSTRKIKGAERENGTTSTPLASYGDGM